MLSLVWPHRRTMTWGMVLGLGVALTYAASLGGILPVLKVVVDNESIGHWLKRAPIMRRASGSRSSPRPCERSPAGFRTPQAPAR